MRCVSVHGANRLGTNSLLDLVVFGKHAGLKAAEFAKTVDYEPLPPDPQGSVAAELQALKNGSGKANAFDLATKMKKIMFDDVGIYRSEKGMREAIEKVRALKARYKQVKVQDTGKIFNTEMLKSYYEKRVIQWDPVAMKLVK